GHGAGLDPLRNGIQLSGHHAERAVAGSMQDLCVGVSGNVLPSVAHEQQVKSKNLFSSVYSLGDLSARSSFTFVTQDHCNRRIVGFPNSSYPNRVGTQPISHLE